MLQTMTGEIKEPRVASIGILGRSGSRTSIAKERFFIGRDGHCDLIVEDTQVSRKHALIQRSEQGFTISDLGSRNGVTINDRKIGDGEKVELNDADCIGLGSTVLVYREGRDLHLPNSDSAIELDVGEVAYGSDTEDELPSHVEVEAVSRPRTPPPGPADASAHLQRTLFSLEGEVRFWKLCSLILAVSCAVLLATLFTERYGSRGEVIRYELPPAAGVPPGPGPVQPPVAPPPAETAEVVAPPPPPAPNQPPSASLRVIGPVRLGHAIVVSASQSSDPEGMPLSFHWSLVALPEGSITFLAADGGLARFIPDQVGEYVVGLSVEDAEGVRRGAELTVDVQLTADQRFTPRTLLRTSLDLIGRPPAPADFLVIAQLPRARLLEQVFTDEAVYRALLELEIERLECRQRPAPELLARALSQLLDGSLDLPGVSALLVLEDSYTSGLSDRDYIEQLLRILVGRIADMQPTSVERGLDMLAGQSARFMGRSGSSRADLVKILVEHEDYDFELGKYVAERIGSDNALGMIDALRADDPRLGFVHAALDPERGEARRPRATYLRRLHFDLFGFDPDQAALRDLLAPFQVEENRLAVAEMLASSPRLPVGRVDSGWVRDTVLRMVGRVLSEEQARSVRRSAGDGVDAMRWVLYSLVTSREYQEL